MPVRNNPLIDRIVVLQESLGYNYFRVEAEYQLFSMLGITSSGDERIPEMHEHAMRFITALERYGASRQQPY